MTTRTELGGEWWVHSTPFRHYRAQRVLNDDDYRRVSEAFRNTIAEPQKTSRTSNYDAKIVTLNALLAQRFAPFFSQPWIDALHRVVSFPNLGHVDAALHSSEAGSRTGWVHTDFCSAWFDESAKTDTELLFPDRSACDYFTGEPKKPNALPVEFVRAAALIYYLCNDGWEPGDGGETGLYSSSAAGPGATADFVQPRNNTALVLPCSPHSYHRFVTNKRGTRNSIIIWAHATIEAAQSRWGSTIRRIARS